MRRFTRRNALLAALFLLFSFLSQGCAGSQGGGQATTEVCRHKIVTDLGRAATCTETGLTEGSHCENCGQILQPQEPIPALGHSVKNGLCEVCGASLGIWETRNYVDQFQDSTSQRYVTTKCQIQGSFSNTAVTDSQLTVTILADAAKLSIMLYEYGSHQVRSNGSREYKIYVKYGNTQKETSGWLSTDRIVVENQKAVLSALCSGQTVRFYLEEKNAPANSYLFAVESSNFQAEYAASINDSILELLDEETEEPLPTWETYAPEDDREQTYFEAQLCAIAYDYDGARALLEQIPDYKLAAEALRELENPLYGVYVCRSNGSVEYLWVRTELLFNAMDAYYEMEKLSRSCSAYRWTEYPGNDSHVVAPKLTQSNEAEAAVLIMNNCYRWEIAEDRSSIAEGQIDAAGAEKGEFYQIYWERLEDSEAEAAIARLKSYLR